MILNELLLLVVIPLAAALCNLFLPAVIRKILTVLSLLLTLCIVYLLYFKAVNTLFYFNVPVFSIDRMGLFAVTFIQLLSLVILIFSLKGVEKDFLKRFFFLFPLTVSFCNAVVLSEHALAFLIFWGLSGLALYLFGTLGRTADSPQTAKKTFIIIGGSDAFLLMGLVIMWLISPGTGWSLKKPLIPLAGEYAHFAFLFLLIAALAKAGGFPFHTWVPEYSKDAPVESAALLPASLDKLLGIYLLARMVASYFSIYPMIYMIMITLGAITVIIAVMMAMIQHNGRKLLGYHAVSQVGYMIMGVGSGSVLAFAGGLFHLINNTIYKTNLFLSLGSVEKKTGTNELDYLGGIGKKMPVTFFAALIGALSISGIPPFNGFFSKWMIYQGLLEKTAGLQKGYQLWMLACILLAVFGSALTLASFMKFIHAVFLGRRPEIYNKVTEAPANQWIATGMLALLCIIFGIFASALPLGRFIYPVLTDMGMPVPEFTGVYNPQLITVLFLIVFLLGIIVYFTTKKVRYDEVYLGGMPSMEKFRIAGTGFYNEIRSFVIIKSFYNSAEKKFFDLYEMGKELTFGFSRIFQSAHPGQLQLYLLYIVLGMLVLIALI